MKRTFAKIGVLLITLTLSVGSVVMPVAAATPEEALANANLYGSFETGLKLSDDMLYAANWQVQNNVWVKDENSAPGKVSMVDCEPETPEEGTEDSETTINTSGMDGINGRFAIRMRHSNGLAVGSMMRLPVHDQIPGTMYKLTARAYLYQAEGDETEIRALLGASNNEISGNNFQTIGAFNPYVAKYNDWGSNLTGVYNEWVTITKYFVATHNWFNIYLGASVGASENNFVLWDDVTLEVIDNVVFDDGITSVEGGEKYGAKVLLGNSTDAEKTYSIIKAVYSKNSEGHKFLEELTFENVTVPVKETYKVGQYRQDITFDLTAYPTGTDYSLKVFVRDPLSVTAPVSVGTAD